MSDRLHLNDVFFTLQGEGFHVGRRALFVRMPYCDLACSWCDTTFDSFKGWEPDAFLRFAASENCRFAVVTGGEPSMHKHTPRVAAYLHELGYYVAMESNGRHPIPEGIDWVTVSPKWDGKRAHFLHDDAKAKANEFKYVIDRGFDMQRIEWHNAAHEPRTDDPLLYLSPEFNEMSRNVGVIVSYIKERPWWRLSLQTHKWTGMP